MEAEVKKIGVVGLTALITGNMIGSAIFLLPSSLARLGSITIISWLITTFGVLILAFVFSRMSGLMPKEGGPYAYVRAGLGNALGFQTALTYWIFCWVGNIAIVIAAVGYLSLFFPLLAIPVYGLIAGIALVWIFTLINLGGAHKASLVSLVATVVKLIPVFLVALFGWFYFHPEYITQSFNVASPKMSNLYAIAQGVLLTLWGLVGVESGTVPANSVKNPSRTIPIATIAGVLIAASAYIASAIVIMGIIPNELLQNSVSPVADAAQIIFGSWGKWMVATGAVISCLGCMNGWILMQGQIPMAIADDNLFFKVFSKRNKHGAPAFGIIISSILITIVLVGTFSPHLVTQYNMIISIATLSVLISYIYTPVAELILYKKGLFSLSRKSIFCAVLAILFSMFVCLGSTAEDLISFCLLLLGSIPLYYFAVRTHGSCEQ